MLKRSQSLDILQILWAPCKLLEANEVGDRGDCDGYAAKP